MAQLRRLDQNSQLTTCPPRPALSGLWKDMQSASPWGRTYLPRARGDFVKMNLARPQLGILFYFQGNSEGILEDFEKLYETLRDFERL